MACIGNSISGYRLEGLYWTARLEAELRRMQGLGFEAAEIHPESLEAIRNGRLDPKATRKAADIFGTYGLRMSVHVPGMVNLLHRTDAALHLDVLRASLQFAEAIDAEVFVFHPGRFIDEEELELGVPGIPEECQPQAMEEEANAVRQLADEFPRITIGVENGCPYRGAQPYTYSERIDLLKRQVLEIDRDNVRITLDIGHLYIASRLYGFDCVEAAKDIAPLIAHTHVHDNFGRPKYYFQRYDKGLIPFGMGDAHMPVGTGVIPVRDILAAYAGTYRGLYTMELATGYYDDAAASLESLATILADLR
jgi:sugar phosphate isomerase/epimerase